jgi:hypothetical protein
VADKSFYRIYDSDERDIKAEEIEKRLKRNIYLGRLNTISSNSNLRIVYDTLTFNAFDEIFLNSSLAVINIKGIFYAIIGLFKIINNSFKGR